MKKLSVILVAYKTGKLVELALKSFEKFKPDDLDITYFVVENSDETSYCSDLVKINPKVHFLSNPAANGCPGSIANGLGIELAKKYITTDYTFLCHSDVCVTSKKFFTELENKGNEGFCVVGLSKDTIRIGAAHASGLLVSTHILKDTSVMPDLPRLDVCDRLTEYCNDNTLPVSIFSNTYNDRSLVRELEGIYKDMGEACGVDRSISDDGEVIYMHLGRGTPKAHNKYFKPGKITHDKWLTICSEILK